MYEFPKIDFKKLQEDRREGVRQLMKAKNIDHILITMYDNIRYATDFQALLVMDCYDFFTALVDSSAEATLFLPFLDTDILSPHPDLPWIKRQIAGPSWTPNWVAENIWLKKVSEEIKREGAKRVGVELLTYQLFEALRTEFKNIEFIPVALELLKLRQIKTKEEIQLLEAASVVNSLAMAEARDRMFEGMTDFEVLAIIKNRMQKCGAEFITHGVAVTKGTPSKENWFAVGNRLWEGDKITLDIGCNGKGGYASDIARTFCVGEPPTAVTKGWKGLLKAYQAGQDIARPGANVSTITRTINEALKKQGLPKTPYGMGHGIGLRAGELPHIYSQDLMAKDAVLEKGMVICIEPSTVVEVKGSPTNLKVEDVFVVESNGLRRLSPCGYGLT